MRQTSIHGARHCDESQIVAVQYCTFNFAVTKRTLGDGEKLLTYLNSALIVLLGTDSFPRVPKNVKICFPVKYVNIHIFFPINLTVTKNCR
jgi:hypothetical protein